MPQSYKDPIFTPAPKDWRPSADQQARIRADSRLQKMSRDDLYHYFNKKGSSSPQKPAASKPAAKKKSSGGGFLGSVLGQVTNALKGDK